MSRSNPEHAPRRLLAAFVLATGLAVGGVVAPGAAQDRTAAWLESQGLDELLARHLEEMLEAARGDESARTRVAGHLARTYARLLRVLEDEARREVIVERSRRMLGLVPEDDAGELRVALVRNRYVRASQAMEDDRIGVAEDGEVEDATRELAAIASELESVRKLADAEVRRLSRGRVRGSRDRIERALELAASAGLLEGWSRYYLGRATDDRSEYERAQLALGSVLQGDSPIPAEDEVSFDLQVVEGYANAILANAMVTSALASPEAAAGWFRRLELGLTHDKVRKATPGWLLASYIDAGDFDEARDRFDDLVADARQQGDAVLPVAWIRLAAVGGLRAMNDEPAAVGLASAALAALAARGELAQVRSLADGFGLDALGEGGFVFAYVRGLDRHRTAIEARDAGEESAAAAGFTDAVDLLRSAIAESDSTDFPEARASATMMIGWSLLELGRTAEAADAFEEAASRMAGDRRADALWGAIVALDRVVTEGGASGADAQVRRDELVKRFLDSFPADDRSPSLVVRRIAETEDPDDDDLDVLLGVPRDHATWETARRRASQHLYRRFRQAEGEARAEAGRRMLDVADELLERDRGDDGIFSDLRSLDGMLLRQAAEVASDEDVRASARAEQYLEQLERALERGALAETPDLPNEILYRKLGVALGDDDFPFAGRLLEEMPVVPDTPDAGRWTRLAALRIHRAVDRLMRQGPVEVEVARAGADAGTRYLELVASMPAEASADGTADDAPPPPAGDRYSVLDRDRFLPIAASVATARAAVHAATDDRLEGEEALAWYRAILERRPRDGSILEATGRLAAALGETELALDAWRRLVRAAPEASELWWQAKVGQIDALVAGDPTTARAVFDQLATLYPDLGPSPWRERLGDLDVRIAVALGLDEAGIDEAGDDGNSDGGGS